MEGRPTDIFAEPDADPDTLANLGPLRTLAGTFTGAGGHDVHPVAGGSEAATSVERIVLEPIDPQTNAPQLFDGLRHHSRIVQPGEVETFHDQVGYWLFEPATETIILTLAIPRGQVAMATERAGRDDRSFVVVAERNSLSAGILSNPFLDVAFRTKSFEMQVRTHGSDSWHYEQTTLLAVADRTEPFRHVDRNFLSRIAAPEPNPLAR